MSVSASDTDPEVLQEVLADAEKARQNIIAKSIDLEWNLAKLGAKTLRTFGEAVAKAVETEGGEQSSAVADIVVDYINDGAEGAASAGEEVTVRGTTELIHKFADAAHGFAEIVGQNDNDDDLRYTRCPREANCAALTGRTWSTSPIRADNMTLSSRFNLRTATTPI